MRIELVQNGRPNASHNFMRASSASQAPAAVNRGAYWSGRFAVQIGPVASP
jgi:hypothetical protein